MAAARQVLIDTNILIDALRGMPAAKAFLLGLEPGQAACSVITVAEIWAGARDEERAGLEYFLGAFRLHAVDERIARAAGDLVRRYGASHGVCLPDALVAATALAAGAALRTRNVRHFPIPELDVEAPYR